MSIQETALSAAQGIDTEDFLGHIAWDECILPRMRETRETLTRQLVDRILHPSTTSEGDTQEMIAGRISGIDFTIKMIVGLVQRGRSAREDLKSQNISLL